MHRGVIISILVGLVAAPARAAVVGGSCGTVTPSDRCECCDNKGGANGDSWCKANYAQQCAKPVGTTCGTVTPSDRCECCDNKGGANGDSWCKANYAQQCEQPPPPPNNIEDYPYVAYIDSPFGPCTGSLIAPGYVLTAAQCLYKNGEAAKPEDTTVWVDNEWIGVAAVHVHEDYAQFDEFEAPKSDNSWDIAMLALEKDSQAQYIALPTSDVPSMGDWITQTAWQEDYELVETASISVWDGCPQGWADMFCAGGSGFLADACPDDKGAPALMEVEGDTIQVGLTSGPGCQLAQQDQGYFVKLADKDILRQILVWLNSREGEEESGLDDAMRDWIQQANAYLQDK